MTALSPYRRTLLLRALSSVFFLTPICLTLHAEPGPSGDTGLRGVVVSRGEGVPLVGAIVHVVELGRFTETDEDGRFLFTSLPTGRFTLGSHAAGYASFHSQIDLPTAVMRIELERDHHFETEVTVTASPWAADPLETAQTVDQVVAEEIRREGAVSLGEALRRVPGVSVVGTGDALGTPVVRGISENRIRVTSDGVPLNHQQFSFRHSPNVEPSLADRIEIVRGPASVLWGPQAMGGVIQVLQAPLPSSQDGEVTLHGEGGISYLGQSNEWMQRLEAEGSKGRFGWRASAVHRDAGDLETVDGPLPGTDYEQTNGQVSLGTSGSWGKGRLRWTHWEDDVGFYRPEGFRLELDDDLLAADFLFPTSIGDLDLLLARQDNRRQAYPAVLAGLPAIDLELVTTTLRGGFSHRERGPWRGKVAFEVLDLDNTSRISQSLLPSYESTNLAVMAFEELRLFPTADASRDRLLLSLGARWDVTSLDVPEDPAGEAFAEDYSALTGSLGVVYRLRDTTSLALSLGRGWRPPNAFELFARGIHGGISAIQLGNPDLEEESNFNVEISARYQASHLSGFLTFFHNAFDRYIYMENTGVIDPATGLPVFRYAQADARLEGLEASIEAVPREGITLGASYSHVSTLNEATDRRLPQSPPDRFDAYARVDRPSLGALVSPMAELEVVWTGEGKISGPDEPFGTPTDAYVLVHLKSGFRFVVGDVVLGVDLAIKNLFDEAYTDFFWPYKAFGTQNPGRNLRLMGTIGF